MTAPVIMLVLFCAGIVTSTPRQPGKPKEPEPPKIVERTAVTFVLDDPESHRFKIGEIDWKRVEENSK